MSKTRPHRTHGKLSPVAIYRDQPLRWKDLLTFFLPASAAPLLPLFVGLWREEYALNHYGPIAAQTWSQPWYQLSIVAMIPLTWLALLRIRRAHRVIKVYSQGITIGGMGLREWKLTWQQINGVSGTKIRYSFLGVPLFTKYICCLHLKQGKTIRLNRNIQNLDELCARIKGKIYPRILQSYRQAFQEGETLHFGPIRMNHQEIILRDKRILWGQLNQLEVTNGFLRFETNQNHPLKLSVQVIPNVEIMLQMIQEGVRNV